MGQEKKGEHGRDLKKTGERPEKKREKDRKNREDRKEREEREDEKDRRQAAENSRPGGLLFAGTQENMLLLAHSSRVSSIKKVRARSLNTCRLRLPL